MTYKNNIEKMNPKQFVQFQLAKRLKHIGFRDECLYHYNAQKFEPNQNNNDGYEFLTTDTCERSYNTDNADVLNCDAPTLTDVQQWFYKNHRLLANFKPEINNGQITYKPTLDFIKSPSNLTSILNRDDKTKVFNDPFDALSEALTMAVRATTDSRLGITIKPYNIRRDFLKVRNPKAYFKAFDFTCSKERTLPGEVVEFLKFIEKNNKWETLDAYLYGKKALPTQDGISEN